ncbi:calmodulin [Naiadivirus wakense]|uniref:Calmodulin n=1 Tax=Circoviridae sp. TaxID=1954248 RepID=A0ABY4CDT9_9VIRU|nr:calmodulin [Circoviridae sp.]
MPWARYPLRRYRNAMAGQYRRPRVYRPYAARTIQRAWRFRRAYRIRRRTGLYNFLRGGGYRYLKR